MRSPSDSFRSKCDSASAMFLLFFPRMQGFRDSDPCDDNGPIDSRVEGFWNLLVYKRPSSVSNVLHQTTHLPNQPMSTTPRCNGIHIARFPGYYPRASTPYYAKLNCWTFDAYIRLPVAKRNALWKSRLCFVCKQKSHRSEVCKAWPNGRKPICKCLQSPHCMSSAPHA